MVAGDNRPCRLGRESDRRGAACNWFKGLFGQVFGPRSQFLRLKQCHIRSTNVGYGPTCAGHYNLPWIVTSMSSAYESIDVPETMDTLINNLANLTHWQQSFAVSLLDQLSYRDLSDKRLWALDALAKKSLHKSTPKWIKPLRTVK